MKQSKKGQSPTKPTNLKELNTYLINKIELLQTEKKYFKQSFEVEKNIKNGLYFFILENGLFEKLKKFEPFVNYHTENFKIKSLEWLNANLPKE